MSANDGFAVHRNELSEYAAATQRRRPAFLCFVSARLRGIAKSIADRGFETEIAAKRASEKGGTE
jgi:hypothetical protein